MQNVSQKWKDVQRKTLVPESFVEILINVGDPDAQADASTSDNGHEFFSNVEQTIDELEKNPIKYATMEPWLWILDGTYRILGEEDIIPDPPPFEYLEFIPFGDKESMTVARNKFLVKSY